MKKLNVLIGYLAPLLLFCFLMFALLFSLLEFGVLGFSIVFGILWLFVAVEIFRLGMALFPNETRMKAALMVLSSIFGGLLIFSLWVFVLFKFGFLYFCIILGIIMLFIAVPIFRCKTPLFRFEKTWWWRQN